MNWKDAEYCVKKWGGPFALKGVMSVDDAKKAIDIGCSAIMISKSWRQTTRRFKSAF